MAIAIYYDGECPFCKRYTALLRLRDSVGSVRLVNVRDDSATLNALQAEGYDLDQGMVVELEGRRYAGADAIHTLAILSGRSGLLNRIVARVFRLAWIAILLYPILRAGRAMTLFALGRERIAGNSVEHQSLFTVFSHAWGLLAYLHLLYYIYYEGSTQVFWTTWMIGGLGAYLTVRARSPRIFVMLCGLLMWDAWQQMPVFSNHTILRNFVLLAIAAAAIYNLIRGRNWSCFMQSFAPIGRCLLVIMYVFGVFHKLNDDFLDPSVSCAVALWQTMPPPLPWLDTEWFRWLAIYGTLIGETAIILCLLFKPTRQAAIITGIGFHSLLALSGYGFYPTFSTIAVALHLLFLSPEAATRITTSIQSAILRGGLGERKGQLLTILWFAGMWLLMKSGNTSSLGLFWLPWVVWLIYLVGKYGRDLNGEKTLGPTLLSRPWIMNVISILFFFNCITPYLGLKTAQSMNMFANLAVEGDYSNHLLLRGKPGPFNYLDDIVKPLSGGSHVWAYATGEGLYLTYYDVLNILERDRNTVVSYERAGMVHENQSYATLESEIDRVLHPRWFRNWFLFRPIDIRSPKPCSLSQ